MQQHISKGEQVKDMISGVSQSKTGIFSVVSNPQLLEDPSNTCVHLVKKKEGR